MSDEAEAVPVKAGGSKLMMGILILNLLGVGGLAAFVVFGHQQGTAQAAEHGREGGGKEATTVGPIVPLESLVVNLQGTALTPESSRYLKVTVQLEAASDEAKAEVDKSLVPIRSRLLVLFSSLPLADAVAPGAVERLQTRAKDMVNEALGARRVSHVFFTEFVVQ